jgi:hypothetical protein
MYWKDKLRDLLAGNTDKVKPEIDNIEKKWLEQERNTIGLSGEKGSGFPRETSSVENARSGPKRYIGIGFDLGTSSTKVVIALRIPRSADAIPFDGLAPKDFPYLLPSKVWLSRTGHFALTQLGEGEWLRETKVALMQDPWRPLSSKLYLSPRPVDAVAAFIGLVLRYSKKWFINEKAEILGSSELMWDFNVGLPARNFDEKGIRDAFKFASIAGWELAQGGEINLEFTKQAVDRAQSGLMPHGTHIDSIHVIPEVAAEVTGYARSDQRRFGPHLLVDIGATTLDSCLFLLTDSDDQNRYAMLAADVRSDLGAFELHRYRVDELSLYAKSKLSAADEMQLIPEKISDYVPVASDLTKTDSSFQDKCTIAAGKTIFGAKRKDPNGLTNLDMNGLRRPMDNALQPNIRVFVCGGGARMNLYRQAVDEACRRAEPGGRQGLSMIPFVNVPGGLPFPNDLSAPKIPAQDYDRLAVAYGLSYSVDDIGIFIPPSDIEEIERTKSVGHVQLTKDDV